MMDRRTFLGTTALGAAAASLVGLSPAEAQAIATLKMFIPAAPGGGWDGTGRAMERALKAANLVQNFQFDNVAGAGGTVGLPRFINMRGQTDTLMVAGMVMVGSIITNKTPVNLTQVTPIARLTSEGLVVVVPAQSPFRTITDMANALKANPGAVSIAGGSAGGSDHILAGMIAQAVGVEPRRLSYVAYAGGGPAQAALLGNQVSAGISGYSEFAEQIKAGKLRGLAMSTEKRAPGIDLPTIRESGLNVDLENWRGVFAPPGIPDAHRQVLITLMQRMNDSAAWKTELTNNQWDSVFLAGDAYTNYIRTDTARIENILKGLGLAA